MAFYQASHPEFNLTMRPKAAARYEHEAGESPVSTKPDQNPRTLKPPRPAARPARPRARANSALLPQCIEPSRGHESRWLAREAR